MNSATALMPPHNTEGTGDGVQLRGWEEPGTFYEADMVGLVPGVVYYYSVGDQWNGYSTVLVFVLLF
jgi:hypothetical protein